MAELCFSRVPCIIPAILKKISRIDSNQQLLRYSFYFKNYFAVRTAAVSVPMHASKGLYQKQDYNGTNSWNRGSKEEDLNKTYYYAVKIGRKPGVYLSWSDCHNQIKKFPNCKCKKFSSEEDAWKYINGMISSPSEEMSYYAVKCGKNPGIYHSWSDCSEQIKGYSNPLYRKFTKEEDAQEYLKGGNKSNPKEFYAVKCGKVPGIYRSWSDCRKQVVGHPKQRYKKFSTEEAAEKYLQDQSVAAKRNESYMNRTLSLERTTQKQTERRTLKHIERITPKQIKRPTLKHFERPTLRKPTLSVESSGLLKLPDPTGTRDFHTCSSLSSTTDENQCNDPDLKVKELPESPISQSDRSCLKNTNDDNSNDDQQVRSPGNPAVFYAVKYGKVPGIYHSWLDCQKQTKGYSNSLVKRFSTEEEAQNFMQEIPRSPSTHSDFVYAVIHGRVPGIYHSWSDCHEQISEYNGAVHRKFLTEEEAQRYMEDPEAFGLASRQLYQDPDLKVPYFTGEKFPDSDGTKVWADGSCFYSKDVATAKAGIGVFWGLEDPDNTSESISGRQTNGRAEIYAVIKAVQLAKKRGINNLIISTDSIYVIRSMNKWIKAWKLRDFNKVVNATDFQILDKEIQDLNIKWVFIPAHSGDESNNMSDKLAKMGAKSYISNEETSVVSSSSGGDVSEDKNVAQKGMPLMSFSSCKSGVF